MPPYACQLKSRNMSSGILKTVWKTYYTPPNVIHTMSIGI